MVRSKESAEDITQEVFIKYYDLSKNDKEYTTSYLYAIAHSKCIDYLRKQKREHLFKKSNNITIYEPSIEEQIFNNEYSDQIASILSCLSHYEKSVLLLKAVNELSYREISQVLGKKEATVRKQFARVRLKIEKMLNKGDDTSHEKVTLIQ